MIQRLKKRFEKNYREALWTILKGPFRTMLMQEFLCEMLKAETTSLDWKVRAEYDSGIVDSILMRVAVVSVDTEKPEVKP